MARAIWTGSINFGLVNIPVGLYSAVSEKTIHFHQLQRGTTDRIRYKRVNEATGDEVDYADIVKGYDVGDGSFVVVDPKELESAEPGPVRTIEIEDFVDQADINPIFYDQAYYVGPKTEAAARPYALLIEAMRASGRVAIARFVLRSKEHLVALRVDGDVLALETMYFSDEIRDPMAEIEFQPSVEGASERELKMAQSLIDSMSVKWDPTNYRDRYRERVEQLIEQKLEGRETIVPRRPEKDSNIVNLMDALQRSVAQIGAKRAGRDGDEEAAAGDSRKEAGSGSESAAKAAANAKRSGGTSAKSRAAEPQGEQLAMLNREELYQLAQDIKVPGRSKMSRDELEHAVAKAQARQAS